MTSKVIEDHKSSSNFSVNPTLPLLDGRSPFCSIFTSLTLSLSIYIYIPLLLYAKNNLHTAKCFWIRFLIPLPFTSLSLSLSLSISPLCLISLFLSHSFYLLLSLSFSLSFSLSLLSNFLSGVSNARFLHC